MPQPKKRKRRISLPELVPDPRGRRPGRAPTELELEHLQLLQLVRGRAQRYATGYDQRLEDFVLRLRLDGCSNRSIAEALDVGVSTVQGWVTNAQRRQKR